MLIKDDVNNKQKPKAELIKGLSLVDAILLTVGTSIGSGLFLLSGDIALSVPSGFWIIVVWIITGLIALAGALTFGELGTLLPKAGGPYVYLKEAYGALAGFLYGWALFLIIWNGGNAAVAAGFAEYVSYFLPALSFQNPFLHFSFLGFSVFISYGQLIAVLAVSSLTFVNYFGLKFGTPVQNLLTGLKIGLIAFFVILGFSIGKGGHLSFHSFFSAESLKLQSWHAFGIALIAGIWAYDGWYAVTLMASEMKNAKKHLSLSLSLGIIIVIVILVLVNLVFLHALPVNKIVGITRIGEAAASALFGPIGTSLLSAVIMISAFGCLNACLVSGPRVYYAMANDGLFFKKLAKVHPKYHSPSPAIIAQGILSSFLCLTGRYRDLYEYVVFALLLFFCFTGAAVFVLRRKYPDMERPYRTWGYPFTPLIFIAANGWILVNMFLQQPRKSVIGAIIMLAGIPAYYFWRKKL